MVGLNLPDRKEMDMGKHSVPRGEKSSYGQANGSPQSSKDYKGKHGAAGSDVPPRGEGVREVNPKNGN